MTSRLTFALSVTLLQCFGIAILVMVGVWTGHYLDGFAWDGSGKEFNYHPVFMIVSMIFLNSQGIYLKYAWINFSCIYNHDNYKFPNSETSRIYPPPPALLKANGPPSVILCSMG